MTPESIRAGTWNNTGSFYVRVQGRNGASSPTPYSITLTTTGGPCTGVTLETKSGLASIVGTPGAARSIVITDTSRMVLTAAAAADFNGRLGQLAGRTGGVVVDLKDSPRVVALNAQADSVKACSYAKNLVAEAIRDIVKSYRDATGTVQSIVLAGDDSVIPFFRYPDTAGLGAEQDYVPPVADSSASQASLRNNQVLGQDAYGSLLDLPVKGGVLPIPDLPVGRLVETPGEIAAQIIDFLGLTNGTLPVPTSSLSTGYDFLTNAADAVQTEFVAGLAAGSTTDTLITDQGIPTTTTTANGVPSRDRSWTAADLRAKLATRHDLTFLAGHFSANSALAADYATSVVTTEFANRPDLFRRSVVFSPGCHSGYNILDPDGVPGLTEGLDWPQLMARQRATLIAGTGYQYADTDFLAYSAKLYAGLARQLRTGPAGTPVAIGDALVAAKQGYLADVVTLTGIDQKTIIQATLFGLPMTGLDMPNRATDPGVGSGVTPTAVAAGTPGAQLGLQTATLSPAIATTVNTRPVLDLAGSPTGANFRWLSGQNGVHNAPALPALPKHVIDATSSTGGVLRGIGFRSGTYADRTGVTPLTGAPVTEQNGIHTSFSSPAFFPQKLANANYFGALGGAGDGRTRVVLTPAQYRSDPGALTNTERAYSALGLSLFYSSSFEQAGGNTPALAAPPSISEVVGTDSPAGIVVSARVTGDPSAGIQQAWVTYTAEAGALHGRWASIDLVQDPVESTLWSGTIALPPGQSAADVRFIMQAANGVGLVGLDNNIGVGYVAGPQVGTTPPANIPTTLTLGATAASAAFGSTLPVSATLVGAPAGAIVTFAVDGATVSATTDASGVASAGLPLQTRVGTFPITASYAGDAQHAASFASTPGFTIVKAATSLTVTVRSGPIPVTGDPTGFVTLRSGTTPLAQKPVLLRVFDATGKQVAAEVRTTNPLGRVGLYATNLPAGNLAFVATFGLAAPGVSVDPSYVGSRAVGVFNVPGLPVLRLPAPITVTTKTTSAVVKYTATAVDGRGVSLVVTCAPKSGSTFAVGTSVVTCFATNSAGERTTGTFTITVVKR